MNNKKVIKKIQDVEKSILQIEKQTKESLQDQPNPQEVSEILQNSWSSITDVLYRANYKETEVLGWKIPTPIDKIISNAHRKKINIRKAMKIVKELAVKKELIRLGKVDEIKKLEKFEKCEDTPMFTYEK